MSLNISTRTRDVQSRFFEALNHLIESNEIQGGLLEFCKRYNLNRTKYSLLRNGSSESEARMTYRTIDIDALSYLCTDYGISARWLLTGGGAMRAKRPKRAVR
jgi:hypothetical protein